MTRDASASERATSQRQESKAGSFRPDIEGLRGVAILAGVLYHSGLSVHGGYVGVDVFFVISGFLITKYLYTEFLESGHISLARFYARRVRRILPVATVVIVVTLLVAWILASPLDIHSTGLGAVTAALFCINYRFAENGTNYFSNTSFSPFQQYWSLAIEEQFYALWPLLILGVTWSTRRVLSSRSAMSIFLVVIIAISFFFSVAQTPSSPSWAYFGLQTRGWELALGALVAFNADWLARTLRSIAAPLSWLGLGVIVVTALLYQPTTSYPGYAALLPVVGAASVVAAGGAGPRRGAESLLEIGPLQYVGRISYSWYLWHWPVLVLLPLVIGHHASTGVVVVALAISFAVASLSYEVVERPFRRNKDLVTYPRRALLLGVTLVAISLVTAFVVTRLDVAPTGSGPPATINQSSNPDVAAATHLQVLPSNLNPPLSGVGEDFPGPLVCLGGITQASVPPQSTCTQGDTTVKRTAVLFGDSHVAMWAAPLAAIAAQRGWRLVIYTKENCSAEDVTNPNVLQESISHCAEWRDAVFARLAVLRPAIVIMSSSVLDSGSLGPTSFAADMTKTIEKLKADGSKAVYIEDIPAPGFNVPDCLGDNPNNVQECSYRLTEGLVDPGTRTAVNQAAAGDGALLIDPIPWLCTTKVCPPIIGNTVAYLDTNHVTKTFTVSVTPELSTALSVVMPAKG